MMRNRVEFMIVWIASMAARTTLVSLNTAFQEEDAAHVIADSEVVLIIAEDEFRAVVETVRHRCRAGRRGHHRLPAPARS